MLFNMDITTLENFATVGDERVDALKQQVKNILSSYGQNVEGPIKLGVTKYGSNFVIKVVPENDSYYVLEVGDNGDIILAELYTPYDPQLIMDNCILQPITTAPWSVEDGKLYYAQHPITIQHLDNNDDDYYPFALSRPDLERDRVYFLPAFNEENELALIVNRYQVGMNPAVAILDTTNWTMYIWSAYNYDHPAGIALREENGDVEIFLDNDGETCTILYRGDQPLTPCIKNFYSRTSWRKLFVQPDFEHLRKYKQWYLELPIKLTHQELIDQYWEKRDSSSRLELIQLGLDYLTYPIQNFRMFMNDCTFQDALRYNLACDYAMVGQTEQAMDMLKTVKSLPDNILDDSDLDSLRHRSDFQELIKTVEEE